MHVQFCYTVPRTVHTVGRIFIPDRLRKCVLRVHQTCLSLFDVPHISRLLFPLQFYCFFFPVSADRCAIPSLSGVHWGLMGSIDMECLDGWVLIRAEATEACRPFSSQRQSYCA